MRRSVSVSMVAAVLLAGCSDAGSEQIDLDDDRAEPTVEPTTEPVDGEPSEGDGQEDPPDDDEVAASLGPPTIPELPPLEPDPDSDVPVEIQQIVLAQHERLYELTQTALHTGGFDEDELATVMQGDLLEETVASFESRAEEGVVSRSPDTTIAWVEAADLDETGRMVFVDECRIVGPESGTFDAASGRRSVERTTSDAGGVIIEVVYEPMMVEEAPTFVAVDMGFHADAERCSA